MSARRLLLALALLTAPASAVAQDVVRVAVGGDLAGRSGEGVDVPVTVDMAGAPGRLLGGYRLRLTWDPAVLGYSNVMNGNFAPVAYGGNLNTDSTSFGVLKVAAIQPGGSSGLITLFTVQFYVIDESATSAVDLTVDDLTQALTFDDLLPFAQITSGSFCRSLGHWGDTNDDGRSDSRDALIALSRVVGLIDTLRIDTLNLSPLVTDTIRTVLADVDGDGSVTSRDALIILSHAVGLPVTGFRIGLTAAGSCATGSATTLEILPGTIDLESYQTATIMVQARDATGRAVPTSNLVWRTSDASVAALDTYDGGDLRLRAIQGDSREVTGRSALTAPVSIEGRSPGTATLTAEMGAGISASITVNVVARRRVWRADIRYLGAATQTGTLAHPFGRIDDALEQAQPHDTVLVAAGVYPETIYQYKPVALLGDPASRPVIDALSVQYYTPGQNVLNLGSPLGKATVSHFVLRGGGMYLEGHDNEVRRVRIEMGSVSPDAAIEIYSEANGSTSGTGEPGSFGNAFIDSVDVIDMPPGRDGIIVDQSDTVIIRNTSVAGSALPNDCSAHAIEIFESGHTEISNSSANNFCQGFYVHHDSETGRMLLSRNRITNIRRIAFELHAPVIRMDHNVARDLVAQYQYQYAAYGLYIPYYAAVDSLSMLGDSIVNSAYKGVYIDTAGVVLIDSLTVSGTGQDSSFGGDGLYFQRGFIRLRFSRIHNVVNASGVRICDNSSAETRGNRVRDVTDFGIRVSSCTEGPGLDSLRMARDTVINAGFDGIDAAGQRHARIDSAFVDSVGSTALRVGGFNRATINAVRLARAAGDGIYMNSVDTFTVDNSLIQLMGGHGMDLSFGADTARVRGNQVDASTVGIRIGYMNALLDSNRVTNHLTDGLLIADDAGVRASRLRLSGNGLGVHMFASARSSYVNRSIIAGNVARQGARNDGFVTLNADTVFWGDPAGPSCDGLVGTCTGSIGDSVLTTDISFANHLTAADPAVPAPPAGLVRSRPLSAARAPGAERVVRPTASAATQTSPDSNTRRRVPKSAGRQQPQP